MDKSRHRHASVCVVCGAKTGNRGGRTADTERLQREFCGRLLDRPDAAASVLMSRGLISDASASLMERAFGGVLGLKTDGGGGRRRGRLIVTIPAVSAFNCVIGHEYLSERGFFYCHSNSRWPERYGRCVLLGGGYKTRRLYVFDRVSYLIGFWHSLRRETSRTTFAALFMDPSVDVDVSTFSDPDLVVALSSRSNSRAMAGQLLENGLKDAKFILLDENRPPTSLMPYLKDAERWGGTVERAWRTI